MNTDQQSSNIPSTGAMTSCFIQAILHGHGTTYWNLINAMRSMISRMLLPQDEEEEEEEEGCCAILCFLATLLTGKSPTSGSRQVLNYVILIKWGWINFLFTMLNIVQFLWSSISFSLTQPRQRASPLINCKLS